MKRTLALALLIFVAVVGWRIGDSLSSDAVSMAVGVFFGVLAGIPTALLVLASRQRANESANRFAAPDARYERTPYLPQPPVIVVTPQALGAGQAGPHPFSAYLPGSAYDVEPGRSRRFKVVGEDEAWLDDEWQ